jgi:polysaccharide export outer membrane protein
MRESAVQLKLARVALLVVLALGPAATTAAEYAIGPGDILTVNVWGQADLSRDYPVTVDGYLPFPLLGRVKADGLTVQQLAERLRVLLEKDYLVNPQVVVSVKEYLSQKVQILGEADKPGLYYLTGPTTLVEMLSRAGGLGKTAGRELIVLRSARSGAPGGGGGLTILRLDMRKVLAGDVSNNIAVERDDMIFVPKAQAFFVLGEVRKPGTFPIEKETTILEAITQAEGFTDKAAARGVKVLRRGADGKQETVALDMSGAVPREQSFKIHDGDTIMVPKGNSFFVFGEVKKPGAYQIDKDTNVLEAITIAGGLTDKAAAGRTRIIRTTSKGQEILYVDVNEILKKGQRDRSVVVLENDVIVVPESFF